MCKNILDKFRESLSKSSAAHPKNALWRNFSASHSINLAGMCLLNSVYVGRRQSRYFALNVFPPVLHDMLYLLLIKKVALPFLPPFLSSSSSSPSLRPLLSHRVDVLAGGRGRFRPCTFFVHCGFGRGFCSNNVSWNFGG